MSRLPGRATLPHLPSPYKGEEARTIQQRSPACRDLPSLIKRRLIALTACPPAHLPFPLRCQAGPGANPTPPPYGFSSSPPLPGRAKPNATDRRHVRTNSFPLLCKEGPGEVESCKGNTPVLHEQAPWAGDSTPPSLPLQRGGGSDHSAAVARASGPSLPDKKEAHCADGMPPAHLPFPLRCQAGPGANPTPPSI